MAAADPTAYLQQVPLFSQLSQDHLQRVAAITYIKSFPRHARLAIAGRPGQAFYYVVAGELLVRTVLAGGRLRPVGYLGAGAFFGTTALLLGEPHDATVEATSEVTALVLYRSDLARLRTEFPDLAGQLVLPEEIAYKPRHKRYPWLSANEVVVFLGKRYWLVYVKNMILPTLGLLLLASVVYGLYWLVQDATCIGPIAILGSAAYLLSAVWFLVNWRNDYLLVTTQRVVRRELAIFQYESRHEAPLSGIQDVNLRRGFMGRLLGYGTLTIQTAAQAGVGRISFDHMPNPEAAKDAIFQQINRMRARTLAAAQEQVQQELARSLGWATPAELQAPQTHAPAMPQPPAPRGRGWLARLSAIRLLPPVRIEEGSRITWRKHHLFLLGHLWKPAVAGTLWALALAAYLLAPIPFPEPHPNPGVILGMAVLGLIIGFAFWWEWRDWENDIYVLTDDRIQDIMKKPLFFSEDRHEATLDRIQNVNLTIPNPLAALLNYGSVDIDTAGGEGQFTFTRVVAPHEVQRDIMRRVALWRERREQVQSQQQRREIAHWFAAYESLREQKVNTSPADSPPTPGEPPDAA